MLREFGAGARTLVSGFALWRTRPGLMNLGLVPAVISLLVLGVALVPLFLGMGSITAWLTPFATDWPAPWQGLLRAAVGFVIAVAAIGLSMAVFTALTLTIGDPFYERIWRAVETDLGDPPPADGGGFWTALAEGLRLVLLGALIALLVLLVGFIPLVGGVLGPVLSVVLSGRLLARELTARAFDARDLSPADRAVLFSGSRARVLGFGVATQLCFLIPGGAVLVTPAAVAGSTLLARDMMTRAAPGGAAGPGAATAGGTRAPGVATTGGVAHPSIAPSSGAAEPRGAVAPRRDEDGASRA